MDKISIIIPAYNEEKRIGKTLEDLTAYYNQLNKSGKLDYELLIVINNTSDSTESIVKSHQKKNKKIRYLNLARGGKGFAVMEGFKDALKRDNDFIGFKDADMSTSPEEYYNLFKEINGFDGVIASRWISGSSVHPKPTIQRNLARFAFNFVIRALLFLPYKDTQCGAKIFKRDAIKSIIGKIGTTQWAFDVDLLYNLRKKGFKIKEVPTKWNDKEYSTINFWQAGPMMVLAIIRLRLLNSPFKGAVRAYNQLSNDVKNIYK